MRLAQLALSILLTPWRISGRDGENRVYIATDATNSTVTPADVSGLVIPMVANEDYIIDCRIAYTAAATTTGILLTWTGPANPTLSSGYVMTPSSTTAMGVTTLTGNDSGVVMASSTAATPTVNYAYLTGMWLNGATAGALQIRFRSEVAASAVVVKAGSFCRWQVGY